ncbi:MAG: membrane-bound lytic murein transglycosylase MltF [Pseudobdellovibrionaceae bacterium]
MRINLRFRQKLTKAFLIGALGFTTIAMNGGTAIYWDEQESLSRVQSKGELVVLTTEDPLIFSKSKNGETTGIDHDLVESFSQSYNLPVRLVVLPNEESVLNALAKGEGDLAAARLRTVPDNSAYLIGPAYEDTHLSLYCHRKAQVENIQDLNGKNLLILQKDLFPGFAKYFDSVAAQIQIVEIKNKNLKQLFLANSQNQNNCILAENYSGDFYSRFFPQFEKVTALPETYSLSWLLKADNHDLLQLVRAWYQKASREDEIMRILDRYKSNSDELDSKDIFEFFKKIRTTLPLYKKAFKEAAKEQELPWQLIASVAYQESHWEEKAISFTGVRGLMQLTEDTADHLGVEDRTDPVQSISGGAKYLRYLLDKLPQNINSQDRLTLALAAYNIGWAHLKDAQKLAERMGRNPYSWRHLRKILPMLAEPERSADFQYGAARGYETVEFVERVKAFYTLLN